MSTKTPNKWISLTSILAEEEDKQQSSASSASSTSAASKKITLGDDQKKTKAAGVNSIAPTRDFMKVANSIARDAVPSGAFSGKAKQLYDYLYSITRGAITPKLTTRTTLKKLLVGADIGSEVTLRLNLRRLESAGLIQIQKISGEHEGSEYAVYLPEEVSGASSTSAASATSSTSATQKVEVLAPLESSTTSASLSQGLTTSYEKAKTLLKTLKDDDDYSLLANELRSLLPDLKPEEIRKAKTDIEQLIAAELRERCLHAATAPMNAQYFVECVRRLCSASNKVDKPKEDKKHREEQRRKYMQIIARIRDLHVGGRLEDFVAHVKRECSREGIVFDLDIFNEIIGMKS
jgi:hypothetical protein